MPGQKGNKGGGRKGYSYERAMQYLIDQSFYILTESLKKDTQTIEEKEKVNKALEVVKKVLGKDRDITSKGKEIIIPIYNGKSKDENE